MPTIRYIHWKADEAEARASVLQEYDVVAGPAEPATMKEMMADPPDCFVIDMTRAPSRGRYLAHDLRKRRPTRFVPIVIVDGAEEKLAPLRELLPGLHYTPHATLPKAVERALRTPVELNEPPPAPEVIWQATPLATKLGIRAGTRCVTLRAPVEFPELLGDLPEGATLSEGLRSDADLAIWFVFSADELVSDIAFVCETLEGVDLWIAWPKKSSGIATDLTQHIVREAALAMDWVDSKICAIDRVWSGMRVGRRRS